MVVGGSVGGVGGGGGGVGVWGVGGALAPLVLLQSPLVVVVCRPGV